MANTLNRDGAFHGMEGWAVALKVNQINKKIYSSLLNLLDLLDLSLLKAASND